MKNISILHRANEFIAKGDYESFLAYCTAETKWVFVGDRILHGKEEVRAYMKEFYQEPPVFNMEKTDRRYRHSNRFGIYSISYVVIQ
ncbi:MAG: nuclear transport factor 2 family protein [Sphingobacterium sp.]